MHDGFEGAELTRIGEDALPQQAPVEGAIGCENFMAEMRYDACEYLLPGLLELASDRICINGVGTESLELSDNGAFATGDIASESNHIVKTVRHILV